MNVYIGGPIVVYDMQGPCPEGFHVPTNTEFGNLITAGITLGAWTDSGLTNIKNYLKIPLAGGRKAQTAEIVSVDFQGYYRCCNDMYYLLMDNYYAQNSVHGAGGYSIRPFKDTPVVPSSSWTTLYQGIGTAGIYYNSTDGLISISSDGTNWITIADKNLGATTVYNSGDTLSEANCGKYYQWGNNYGFPFTGSVTTSSTLVDASTYGPGNYYNSSTFITNSSAPYNWDSSNNDNLWGGITQGTTTKYNELQNAYIGEAPYEGNELCFTANTANSTVQLNKNGSPTAVTLETSTDGTNWSTYTIGSTITLSNVGDKVYWRNTSTTDTRFSIDDSNYYKFVMTGSIAGSGDINYLLNKNSTTTVSNWSHYALFFNCKSLTKAPSLPATTLADYCYKNMFRNCTSLTKAPSLPATTLANECYDNMFNGCTSLTTAQSLPATTLANKCYAYMFYDCTSLTSLPKLPATTLAQSCYRQMFYKCTSIKLSTTQTGEYQTAYRIPTTGTGTTAKDALYYMFGSTGGTFTGTPSINTTYYTSNTVN